MQRTVAFLTLKYLKHLNFNFIGFTHSIFARLNSFTNSNFTIFTMKKNIIIAATLCSVIFLQSCDTTTATAKTDIFKGVAYYGKVDFYANLIQRENKNGLDAIDMFWTNQFKFKVGKYFNISYGLDMLYDDDVKNPIKPTESIGLQVLSTFGVGFNYKM